MARRTDKNGVSWEVDAQGNPVPGTGIRPGNMKPDPMKPVELRRATNEAAASDYAPLLEEEKLADSRAQRALDERKFRFEQQQAAAALAKDGLEMLPDGSVVPLKGGIPKAEKDNSERRAQIQAILGNIKNLRKEADDWLAVGKQGKNMSEWAVVGGLLGQNRANVEGILQQLQGDMIQQQMANMSANQGGGGVTGLGNSEVEAARIAASIANLSPDQDYEQFVQGIDMAEAYYNRQLKNMGPEKTRADFKRGDGVETSFEGGEYLTDEDQKTGGILQFRFDQGGGVNELNQALQDENKKRVEQGLTPYDLYRPGTKQWQQLGDAIKYRDGGGEGAKISPPVSGYQESSFLGGAGDSQLGAFGMKYFNAAAMGLPAYTDIGNTNMALDYAGEEYPAASFLGEAGGLITGAAGIGAIGGKVAGKYAPRLLNGGKWGATGRGVATDGTQGALYGGFNNGDPFTGSAAMGGGRLAGDITGRVVGRTLRKPGIAAINTGGAVANSALAKLGKDPRFSGIDYAPAPQKADGLTLGRVGDDSIAQLQDAQRLGMPMALADTSPALQKLAGSAVRKSDDALTYANNTIEPRGLSQPSRALNAVETHLTPVGNVTRRQEDLITEAYEQSKPLYEEAWAAPGAGAVFERLEPLLQRPTMKEALKKAQRSAADDEGFNPEALGFNFNEAGDVVFEQVPSWQAYDRVKIALDDLIKENDNPVTGGLTSTGRSAQNLKRELLSVIDAANPAYPKARAAYGGPVSVKKAIDDGRGAGDLPPDVMEGKLRGYSGKKADAFRLGVAANMVDGINKTKIGSDPYRRVYGSTEQRANTATLFPNGAQDFGRIADIERSMGQTRGEVLYGSQTRARQEADGLFDTNSAATGIELGSTALGGGAPWYTMAKTALKGLGDTARIRGGEKMGAELAPVLLNPNPTSALQYLDEGLIKKAAHDAQRAQARRLGGIFGAPAGAGLYAFPYGE